MKIFIVIFLIAFSNLGKLEAQNIDHGTDDAGIQFFKGSWDEALTKAENENKPIFLDVYATWCGPCKVLKRKTFPDVEAGKYFNKNFINVSLDGEKEDGKLLVQELNVQAYPSLFILNSKGKPVVYYSGFLNPDELIELGKAGIDNLNN